MRLLVRGKHQIEGSDHEQEKEKNPKNSEACFTEIQRGEICH